MNNLIQEIDISTVFVYTLIVIVEVAEFLLANNANALYIYTHKYIIFNVY